MKKAPDRQWNLLFSFRCRGNYFSETRRKKISIMHHTASGCFSDILMLPGQHLYFLCADFSLDDVIPKLFSEKNIETSYIHGNISPERISGYMEHGGCMKKTAKAGGKGM